MIDKFLGRYRNLVYQFGRFGGIGFLNASVDFTILNLLIATTGITGGGKLSLLNSVSFIAALLHSYWWNKHWAFASAAEAFLTFAAKIGSIGVLGVAALAGAIYGAKVHNGPLYYIALFAALIAAEIILWKLFGLKLPSQSGGSGNRQFAAFAIVSIIGLLINDLIVGITTNYIDPQFGLNPQLWANFAKGGATLVALVWNFSGYKLLVFKK